MEIIWHGTASVELRSEDSRILVDPFVPLKRAQWSTKLSTYDGFSDILITHGHFDHIASIPAIIARNPGTIVHCTATPFQTLLQKGVSESNLAEVRYGETLSVGRFCVQVLHGKHAVLPKATFRRVASILCRSSIGNLPYILRENRLCRENDETVLYVIGAEGREVTLMGSLNLRDGDEYPTGSDLLVLPYNGWEDNFPPAVEVIGKLMPRQVLLTHWDNTFPPVTGYVDRKPILQRYPGIVKESGKEEVFRL